MGRKVSRKALLSKLKACDDALQVRQAQLVLDAAKSRQMITRYSPYLIVSLGLLAGIISPRVGLSKAYRFTKTISRLYPLLINRIKPNQQDT